MEKLPQLKWKCLDNFDSVENDSLFFNADIKINQDMRAILAPVFEKFAYNLEMEIRKEFGQKPEHNIFTGGNHTFYFVLPKVFKWLNNDYKFINVRLKLDEANLTNGVENLVNHKDGGFYEIIVGGYSIDASKIGQRNEKPNWFHKNYMMTNAFLDDKVFSAISLNIVKHYDSMQEALDNHFIVLGRTETINGLKNFEYYTHGNQIKKKTKFPNVVSDSHFMANILMHKGIGIWHVFSSLKEPDTFILDEKPLEVIRRVILCKRNSNFLKIRNKLLHILKND